MRWIFILIPFFSFAQLNPMLFYQLGKPIVKTLRFDTVPVETTLSTNRFVVRRSSDNVEQTFTSQQINDGTYTTFLGGATGFLKTWFAENGTACTNTTTSNQPTLLTDGTFHDSGVDTQSIQATHTLVYSGHYIYTYIFSNESNSNNQRSNVAFKFINGNGFAFNIYAVGGAQSGQIFFKTDETLNVAQCRISPAAYTASTKVVLVAEVVNGIYTKILFNGVNQTIVTGSFTQDVGNLTAAGKFTIGARNINDSGKITKVYHAGIFNNPTKTAAQISSDLNAVYAVY